MVAHKYREEITDPIEERLSNSFRDYSHGMFKFICVSILVYFYVVDTLSQTQLR